VHVEDLDISPGKVAETAQRIIDRAIEEARRREHALLTNEHLFLAFAQVEWDMFAEVMRDVDLNPHTILQAIEEHLHMMPSFAGRELRVSPATKLVFKLALHHASRAGRQTIEAPDLFSAVFEETQGTPVSILRRHGVEPDVLVSRLTARMRDMELREERLKKRFELPPFLKHFATNLNLLARQDKLPPVFGRDKEIQQVLEILCHRERANSVMLIGEPGVGKTAIAEGLARRIEFEPESVPVRLRDCQVVNLAMNSMVAGTMLRGMFEDRIQNVIRELKERTNLILFVDEAHTMVGAGSALGAPSTPPTSSSRCSRAAKSGWSPRPRSANTRSTSRRTRRWRAASAASPSASRASTRRGRSSTACGRGSSGSGCGARLSAVMAHYSGRYPKFQGLTKFIACSINQEYAQGSAVLKEGDEVGLLPPVSGGKSKAAALQSAHCAIVREPIDIHAIRKNLERPEDGSALFFDGIVRNNTRGRRTLFLDYEAYESMALMKWRSWLKRPLNN